MSVISLERNNPETWNYALKDKLWNHVIARSEEAFKKSEKVRRGIKSKEELEEYNEKMRNFFINDCLSGIPYDSSLPLNSRITGVIEEEGLKIEKVIFESRPNVYVTGNLYIPEKRNEKCGAVIFQSGHSEGGKEDANYQRVIRTIASAGLIVFSFDPLGQGERFSYYEKDFKRNFVGTTVWDHQYTGEQCVLVGDNIARYFIADAMRAVDYLVSRPEVDAEKIGATGNSGGGTMTACLSFCDSRIKASAPGTFVTTRKEYLYAGGAQDSEQIWYGATQKGFDHYELIMGFAPKPLLLLTVDSDFFPIEGAHDVFNECSRFYSMYGKKENLKMVVDKSIHKYTPLLAEKAAEFFAKELNGEERKIDPSLIKSLDEKLLWCTEKGQVRAAFENAKFAYEENLARLKNCPPPKKSLKEFLNEKISFDREKEPYNLRTFATMYERDLKVVYHMWFSQRYLPNYGLLFSKDGAEPKETVICLWPDGTDHIEEHIYTIRNYCNEGKAVLVMDLSGMGKCAPHPLNPGWADKAMYGVVDRLTKDLFFLGDSLCALRLFELEYIIGMLEEEHKQKVSLHSTGNFALYAKLIKELHSDIDIFCYEQSPDYREIVQSKYYENYNISAFVLPGIAQYYKA